MNKSIKTFGIISISLGTLFSPIVAKNHSKMPTNSPISSCKHCITFAVFSINDFHGAFVPNKAKGIPGAPSIWQCVDSLKKVYPYHVTVAAGDNFGGSYFYNATKGVLLPVFFNDLGIKVSALGNHEFDDGQASLAKKWADDPLKPKDWNITYVCANVFKDGKLLPYEQPYYIENIPISADKTLKVAFVGLLASSAHEQIRAKNIVGIEFSGRYRQILDSLKQEPSFQPVKEANIRNLLVHIGTDMKNGQPKWSDKNEENLYSINDPFYHSILSGHSHEPVCGYINKIKYPVVQGWWHGNYINVMKYTVDTTDMKIMKVVPEIVRVPLKSYNQLGKPQQRLAQQIDSLLTHTKIAEGVSIGQPLTVCKESLLHDRAKKFVDSPMGRLVCSSYSDAYRHQAHLSDHTIVVGISHFGSIRGGFPKGEISVLDVGEALPFSNALKVYKMTGTQLLKLIDFGYHNKKYGWIQCSNLKIIGDSNKNVKRLIYVSPKGKKIKITSKSTCYVVADEFITTGGDGYSPTLFPEANRINVQLPATTAAFINYLKQQKSIPNW